MTRIDEDQRFREERAEQLRERDRQREPRSFRRLARDIAARDTLRIRLVERTAAAQRERLHVAFEGQLADIDRTSAEAGGASEGNS